MGGTVVILESSCSGVQSRGPDFRDMRSERDEEDGAGFV